MTTALAKASGYTLCGDCGGRLTCTGCGMRDAIESARAIVLEVLTSPGRHAIAQLSAAKIVLAKDFLAYLTDDDLLAEVRRRERERP